MLKSVKTETKVYHTLMEDKTSEYPQSVEYSKYRPKYPQALFDVLFEATQGREKVLDICTGTGQVAFPLSKEFGRVEAFDLSSTQLAHAL